MAGQQQAELDDHIEQRGAVQGVAGERDADAHGGGQGAQGDQQSTSVDVDARHLVATKVEILPVIEGVIPRASVPPHVGEPARIVPGGDLSHCGQVYTNFTGVCPAVGFSCRDTGKGTEIGGDLQIVTTPATNFVNGAGCFCTECHRTNQESTGRECIGELASPPNSGEPHCVNPLVHGLPYAWATRCARPCCVDDRHQLPGRSNCPKGWCARLDNRTTGATRLPYRVCEGQPRCRRRPVAVRLPRGDGRLQEPRPRAGDRRLRSQGDGEGWSGQAARAAPGRGMATGRAVAGAVPSDVAAGHAAVMSRA
jgi:hypothetical protein